MVEIQTGNFATVDEIEARIAASREANERTKAEIEAKQRELERKFPKLTAVAEIDAKLNKFNEQMQAINDGFVAIMTGKAKPKAAPRAAATRAPAAAQAASTNNERTNRSNSRRRFFNGDGNKHTNQRI